MGYLSLYRKWRPKNFQDLTGQRTVVQTLKNALINNRIAHAYLFCGPRGTGKTSTAKVFAKSLNCAEGPTLEPCEQCFSCQQINSGRSVDVIEIDAASNRRIDEIRELRQKVKFSPSEGDYKVYIIDEVHMLTKEAFNALLKTLEEPPENVVFILATTEPHKVIPTIQSRCQRFDFGLLSIQDLKERMEYIAKEEGILVTESALTMIARTAEGGMRDAISTLDQAIAYGGQEVTVEDVTTILGKVDEQILSDIVQVIADQQAERGLALINQIIDQGKDVNQFMKDLIYHFRDLMLIKECGVRNQLIQLPDELKQSLAEQAEKFSIKELLQILEVLSDTDQKLKFSSQPRLLLEMTVIQLTSPTTDVSLTNLIQRIAKVEEVVNQTKMTPTPGRKRIPEKSHKSHNEQKAREEQITSPSAGEQKNTSKQKQSTSLGRKASVPSVETTVSTNGKSAHTQEKTSLDQAGQKAKSENPGDLNQEMRSALDAAVEEGNAAGLNISLQEMEKYWEVTMELLNKYSETRKLRAMCLPGEPCSVQGRTLYLRFPKDRKFHKENAEKEIAILEKALVKVIGEKVKVVCIFSGEEPSANPQPDGNESEKGGGSERKDMDITEDPIVQKAVKIFGGEVISLENE